MDGVLLVASFLFVVAGLVYVLLRHNRKKETEIPLDLAPRPRVPRRREAQPSVRETQPLRGEPKPIASPQPALRVTVSNGTVVRSHPSPPKVARRRYESATPATKAARHREFEELEEAESAFDTDSVVEAAEAATEVVEALAEAFSTGNNVEERREVEGHQSSWTHRIEEALSYTPEPSPSCTEDDSRRNTHSWDPTPSHNHTDSFSGGHSSGGDSSGGWDSGSSHSTSHHDTSSSWDSGSSSFDSGSSSSSSDFGGGDSSGGGSSGSWD